jgi:hypothetical protein
MKLLESTPLDRRIRVDLIAQFNRAGTLGGHTAERGEKFGCILLWALIAVIALGGIRYIEGLFPSVTEFTNTNGDCVYVIDERSDRRDQKGCDFLAKYGGEYNGPLAVQVLP